MEQPVEDGGGEDLVVEDLAPVDEALVARHDEAGSLVAADQEPEEQAGLLAGERQVTEFVEDEHPRVSQLLEDPLEAVLVAGADETSHQALERQKQDGMAGLDRFDAQADRQVSLADAGRDSHMLRSFRALSPSTTAGIRWSVKR